MQVFFLASAVILRPEHALPIGSRTDFVAEKHVPSHRPMLQPLPILDGSKMDLWAINSSWFPSTVSSTAAFHTVTSTTFLDRFGHDDIRLAAKLPVDCYFIRSSEYIPQHEESPVLEAHNVRRKSSRDGSAGDDLVYARFFSSEKLNDGASLVTIRLANSCTTAIVAEWQKDSGATPVKVSPFPVLSLRGSNGGRDSTPSGPPLQKNIWSGPSAANRRRREPYGTPQQEAKPQSTSVEQFARSRWGGYERRKPPVPKTVP
ncbi:hypothetical protein PMIN01_01897 [Paraphaeosphaeria minitans]|uniref:Uncharacterized protein n=1 Tax=Paraphaeosphaeria minitans TaxID=565426 RepID=A0A9P6GPP5_9PLEO|nr:hypothetical protein PMIN01_01897 [Paraphaeosphaeria minitans]